MKPGMIGALLFVALCIGAGVGATLQRTLRPAVDNTKLRDYCTSVHAGLLIDAVDLESGDPKRQEAASDRFLQPRTFHSWDEVQLCRKGPVDLRTHDDCYVGQNFACLARLARAAVAATDGH